MSSQVIIIMGSKGDLPHAQAVAKTLMTLEIGYEMRVCSAHKATSQVPWYISPSRDAPTRSPRSSTPIHAIP